MKYSNYFFFTVLLASMMVEAKFDKNAENKKTAIEIIDRYGKAKFITADIEKTDEKIILDTKTISKGIIKYSAGKFYLLLQSDKKAELFFKGRHLTLVDYPDLDFDKDGARKITRIKDKTPAFLKSLIDLFSNSKVFFDQFKILDTSIQKNILILNLKPTRGSLKNFQLELNTKEKTIQAIHFTDDVKTVTTIQFNHLDLKTMIPKEIFEFKAKKSDQEVTQ